MQVKTPISTARSTISHTGSSFLAGDSSTEMVMHSPRFPFPQFKICQLSPSAQRDDEGKEEFANLAHS
jgi:hypothetical protein